MVREGRLWTDIPGLLRPLAASVIATNNIQVSILAFAGGILLGTLTVYVLVLNGLLFGAMFGYTHLYGLDGQLVAFVSPHGYMELTVIFIAGGAGLRIAWAIVTRACFGTRRADPGRPGGDAAGGRGAAAAAGGRRDRGAGLAVQPAGRFKLRWASAGAGAACLLAGW